MQKQDLIYTAEQTRDLDRIAIDKHGIASFKLMQKAGQFAFSCLRAKWRQAEQIQIFCGTGNNGGDGFILAALALQAHLTVQVVLVGDPEKLSSDSKKAKELAQDFILWSDLEQTQFRADVIVDALLGTGLNTALKGDYLDCVRKINHSSSPVLALDLPTGLNPNTGCPLGESVRADLTVTFVGRKQGLLTGMGKEYAGEVQFSDLDLPDSVYQSIQATAQTLSQTTIQPLPKRARHAHKGAFGHVLIVGGDQGMGGAVCLAGEAVLRGGAGLCSLVTQTAHLAGLLQNTPEIMTYGIDNPEQSTKQIDDLIEKSTVIALGPGLGQRDWGVSLFNHIKKTMRPMVLDADGLNLLAQNPFEKDNWILTPHPGEAARLLGKSVQTVESDRFLSVQTLQRQYGGVVVLKGAGTLIYDGRFPIFVCEQGNPNMACGGMGDLLTGLIAAFVAQGLSLLEAAKLGVFVHANAGDQASRARGVGLKASDLFLYLQNLLFYGK